MTDAQPPYANRGVYPPAVTIDSKPQEPVFDAYTATVYAHPDLILPRLKQAIQGAGEECLVVDGPKHPNYAHCLAICASGRQAALLRHGGQNPHPYVEAVGPFSAVIGDTLRAHFNHLPKRQDSAIDRHGLELFSQLNDLAKRYEAKGIQLDYAGASIDNPDRGTTIYLGSRKSQAFVRIYQKGLQVAQAMGLTGDQITPELRGWVRTELEYKGQKRPSREAMRLSTPSSLWGFSQWTRDFAMEAHSLASERVNVSHRRETDHERALRFMAHQYRAHLDQLMRSCGGDRAQAMSVLLDLAGLELDQAA